MSVIDRLLVYRERKVTRKKEPDRIVLNWKHLLALEAWCFRCGLEMNNLLTVVGYRVLGMTIINKGR